MQDSYVKELMTTVKCPTCGERYQFGNINVLGHQDELWFVSVFCEGCQNQGFVAALIKEIGSDENEADMEIAARVDAGEPVSADEVLDMHEFLEVFDGDFVGLFNKGNEEPKE